MKLLYALKKEVRILLRNKSALLALFLMPALFILIMSVAQKDIYKEYSNADIQYIIVNDDNGTHSIDFINVLKKEKHITLTLKNNLSEAKALTKKGKYTFILHIKNRFSRQLYKITSTDLIDIYLSPSTKAPVKLYFESKIIQKIMMLKMKKMLDSITMYNDKVQVSKAREMIHSHYIYEGTQKPIVPTATQQNVPAWIVFAMFFVIIPISTLFITERNDGTLLRLKAMNSPIKLLMLSKIIPYMLLNQIQLYLMICVGVFLVPLFGGDRLDMDINFLALLVISLAISFAAIGFALFLATLMKSIEQASIVGALSAVIMGAVGGIMIPKLVMPPIMQTLTLLSPMSWGLEGMLDVFVRKLSVTDVLYEVSILVILGIISISLSIVNYKRT